LPRFYVKLLADFAWNDHLELGRYDGGFHGFTFFYRNEFVIRSDYTAK
jgi:hypothetical protein